MVLNWLEELKARVPTKRLAYSSFVVNGSGQVLPGRAVFSYAPEDPSDRAVRAGRLNLARRTATRRAGRSFVTGV
jgi:hypothetical protein